MNGENMNGVIWDTETWDLVAIAVDEALKAGAEELSDCQTSPFNREQWGRIQAQKRLMELASLLRTSERDLPSRRVGVLSRIAAALPDLALQPKLFPCTSNSGQSDFVEPKKGN